MNQFKCPVCNRRVCDSEKELKIEKKTNANTVTADVIIKCKNCKSCLTIEIVRSG